MIPWRTFCEATDGLTLKEIEEATGLGWGTLLAMSMRDQVPNAAFAAVVDAARLKRVGETYLSASEVGR
jgi:hypothetical protein